MPQTRLEPWPRGKPPAPDRCAEEARLQVLQAYRTDALEDDAELSDITDFAARLCNAPIAMVSLVEAERQYFLARTGLADRETPRPPSFCAHAMLGAETMVVADALEDERFSDNPLVTGNPHIRFYAGAPLISHEGAPLGALCVIDTAPRPDGLTDVQKDGLEVLAAAVMRRLWHRREALNAKYAQELNARQLEGILDSLPQVAFSIDQQGNTDYVNARFGEATGRPDPANAEDWRTVIHPDDYEPLYAEWLRAMEAGVPFEAQFRVCHRQEEWRWALCRVQPMQMGQSGETRWFGLLVDNEEAHREMEKRDILARELAHRIKNIFAVINGLVALKLREWPEAAGFSADLNHTLATLSRAHQYATNDRPDNGETLHGLMQALMEPYRMEGAPRLAISGDDMPVVAKAATPLALVFHELATNSAKYGALSRAGGRIAIESEVQGDDMRIVWREEDGPPARPMNGTGFGSRLVDMTVTSQLRGRLERDFEEGGLVATLTLPTAAL